MMNIKLLIRVTDYEIAQAELHVCLGEIKKNKCVSGNLSENFR